jgi:hypothetical protein
VDPELAAEARAIVGDSGIVVGEVVVEHTFRVVGG